MQVEDALLGPPVVWGPELQSAALRVPGVEGDRLTLLHVKARYPHVVVNEGRGIDGGEVLDYLQGHEPRVHQKGAGLVHSPDAQGLVRAGTDELLHLGDQSHGYDRAAVANDGLEARATTSARALDALTASLLARGPLPGGGASLNGVFGLPQLHRAVRAA